MPEWLHPDGTRRVRIERAGSARFHYREDWIVRDVDFGATYEYWCEGTPSGLYSSIVDARNDAARRLPWLRALLDASAGPDSP